MNEVSDVNNLVTLRISIAIVVGIFWVAAAATQVFNSKTAGRQSGVKGWFDEMWLSIQDGRWLYMPELMLGKVLEIRIFAIRRVMAVRENRRGLKLLVLSSPWLAIAGAWITWGWIVAIVGFVFLLGFYVFEIIRLNATASNTHTVESRYGIVFWAIVLGPAPFIWIAIAINTNIVIATLIMLVASVYFGITLAVVLSSAVRVITHPSNNTSGLLANVVLFPASAAGVSFVITFIALTIGSAVAPDNYLPQTYQMLVSNVIFDAITMIVTFGLISWAVKANTYI